MEIFLYLMFILIAACIWSLVANEITYSQRIKMLHRVSDDAKERIKTNRSDYLDNYTHMNAVSYDTHFRNVFLFQNTKSLYHPDIQELM